MVAYPRVYILVRACCLALFVSGCSSESSELSKTPDSNVTAIDAKGFEDTVESTETDEVAAFYTVSHYDETRDPHADLSETIERARDEKKRILMQVGGEWCAWCHRISNYMETNEKVRKLIDEHFLVLKITSPSEHVDIFLAEYPKFEGYPHLFVLDEDGTLLHSQDTAELEKEKSYSQAVFSDFLTSWIR